MGMTSIALKSQASPYEDHKDHVLSVLARRCRWLNPADREATYHDAYEVYLSRERSGRSTPMAVHELRSFLTRAAMNKAFDQGKAAERRYTVGFDAALARPDDAEPIEERVADAAARVPVREIVEELTERQRAIVKLRFWGDLSAEETWTFLGISRRAYRKEFELAMRTIGERYEVVREGRWCESRRSVVLAYIAGVAGPRKELEARMHLSGCPGCTRMAAELRRASEHAAAALPIPDAALGDGPLTRLAETATSLRDQTADLGVGVKHHAAGLVGRADPSTAHYAAGARPGAMVAAVASCVAIGGGAATYCATQGLPDPIRPVFGLDKAEHGPEPKPERPDPSSADETAPPSLPAPLPPQETQAPAPAPVAPPAATPAPEPVQPPPPPVQQAREFGPEQAAPSSSAGGSAESFGAPAPAGPAPSGGGDTAEFGP